MNLLLVLPSFICLLTAIGLLTSSFLDHRKAGDWQGKRISEKENQRIHFITCTIMAVCAALTMWIAWTTNYKLVVFHFVDGLPVYLHSDNISCIFLTITCVVWTGVTIYSMKYMSHEGNEKRFYGFMLLAFGVLVLLDLSGNLVTFYLCYELMTLTSMPLVLHSGSREAIMAAMKYLFYSMCGAYCALFGIFMLYKYTYSLVFTPGGTLNPASAAANQGIVLVAVFMTLIGFGAKAGMFPLHAWLPAAHPVAPAPASAALSAIIVKCGVLGLIRIVYFIVGPDFIRGTWVQYAWMSLTLITVFMGSLLAFREKVFKKRLAYSTVSQISYIVFGLSVLDTTALTGSLLHVIFHALVKAALFTCAGILIFRTGKTRVDEYRGIGKKYPLTLWIYTFAALTLTGIPPTSGFISKWYLATGALEGDIGIFRYLGPVVLLISALLTAGYLLPISIQGFLPGNEDSCVHEKEKLDSMSIVPFIFVILAVLMGVFPGPFIRFFGSIAATLV